MLAGDLVENPVSFSDGADVDGWMSALRSIGDLEPGIVIPGHGNVLRDSQQVRTLHSLLAAIVDQTTAAAANGETLAEVREHVDVSEFRNSLVGDNNMLAYLFNRHFLQNAISSTFSAVATDRQEVAGSNFDPEGLMVSVPVTAAPGTAIFTETLVPQVCNRRWSAMNIETWEVLSYIVTVPGLPVAVVVFYWEKRKGRAAEEEEVYEALDIADQLGRLAGIRSRYHRAGWRSREGRQRD